MFVPFLIMFREGLEAALIVSLIASYLKRTQRGQWMGAVWVGVVVAAVLCLAIGIFINETTGEFSTETARAVRRDYRCSRGLHINLYGFLDAQSLQVRQSSLGRGN